jgi:glycosyltransferase involved in cell wall biosynthesis
LKSRLEQIVDVLVHSSLGEAHCSAVNEAIAIGMPVVDGMYSDGIPPTFAYDQIGLLVDVASPTSIAQGMRTMLQDADLPDTPNRSWGVRAFNEYWLEEAAGKSESVLENARQERTR